MITFSYVELLYELCREPRVTGSKANGRVQAYLKSLFDQFGYAVELQEFPFTGWEVIEPPRVTFLEPEQLAVKAMPVMWSPTMAGDSILGRLKRASGIKTFEIHPWERYGVSDEQGRALAYLMTRRDVVWPQPLSNPNTKLPHVMVGTETRDRICNWLRHGSSIVASVSFRSNLIRGLKGCNVIAVSNAGCDIVVAAHCDSVPQSLGAHDNASGVASLMSVAAARPPGIMFIAFDAEEWNKLGSIHFVKARRAAGELRRVRLMINLDSVGFGDTIYLLVSPGIMSAVSSAIAKSANLKKAKIEILSEGYFQQFDLWPFMKNGIPVVQIGTRSHQHDYDYFHHPNDTIDKIDFGLIEETSSVACELIRRLRETIHRE